MIYSLTGTLVEASASHVVLDVSGVGWELKVSGSTAAQMPAAGSTGVTLLTRLTVRENALDLFGFASVNERAFFDRLTAVNGVGPRLALSVLSTFSPEELARVVVSDDAKSMQRVPGVGKKTATRLVMELADVLAKDADLAALAHAATPQKAADTKAATSTSVQDAQAALLSMGFTPQEAELALEGADAAGATTVEALLSFALRRLGGRS